MRGYHLSEESEDQEGPAQIPRWEALVADAVGTVIEFWGFKRSQGRVWALLYLRDRALSAADIQAALGLSKGAVSMVTRELEQWGVVYRTRPPGDDAWRFGAETDFLGMVVRVLREREHALVARVLADLEQAEKLAASSGAPKEALMRIRRMQKLASFIDRALRVFMQTARLDAGRALAILTGRRK